MSTKILQTIFALFLLTAGSQTLNAQRWEDLGSRVVNWGLDKDIIKVTYREGKFNAIKFVVRGGAVNMHRCIVHFENGETQEIALKHQFRRGDDSRVIDLVGNQRFIDRIVFFYDTKNRSRHRAVVNVWGRH